MPKPKAHEFRKFLLRLALSYVVLTALWFAVKSHADLLLGRISAGVVRIAAHDDITVRRVWKDDKLRFDLLVDSKIDRQAHVLKPGVDPVQFGFAHVTFASLAFAIWGWTWRRRLSRWAIGAVLLQAFFVFMVVAQILSGIAKGVADTNVTYWSGDIITAVIPYDAFMQHRDFLAVAGGQFMPVLLWLGLFVFPSTPKPRQRATIDQSNRTARLKTRTEPASRGPVA